MGTSSISFVKMPVGYVMHTQNVCNVFWRTFWVVLKDVFDLLLVFFDDYGRSVTPCELDYHSFDKFSSKE